MSERGDALIDAVAGSPWMFSSNRTSAAKEAARSICEHLGITWEAVNDAHAICSAMLLERGHCGKCFLCDVAERFATLLEAAGIER